MADPLMVLSLQPPPPFLNFPCSLHRRWVLSRSGIRFSVPELRLSSQLQLANSTSPSQSSSSSSAPEKLDLVSTTQLKDGSHVFRFGDASEIERVLEREEKARSLELKQHAEIKEGVKDGHALVDLDRVSELESPKEKSVVKKKPVKSNNIETVSEKEEGAAPTASLSSVIKIKDRKRVRSPVKKKKETPSPVDVLGIEDEVEAKVAAVSNLRSIVSVAEASPASSSEEKAVVSRESEPISENVEPLSSEVMENDEVEGEVASVSNLSTIVSVAEAIPTSSSEEKAVVSRESESINENVEPLSSEVMEKVSVNEIRDCEAYGYQQLTENRVEVQARPGPSSSQHDPQLNDLKEVAHVSTIELDDSLEERENLMKNFEAEENLVVDPAATVELDVAPDELVVASPDENLVVEPTATVAVSPDELISTSEATNHRADETAETPVIDTSEVANDGENVASTIEDEVAVIDSKNDNGSISKTVNDTDGEDLQLPEPKTAGLQPIELASDREELVSKAFYLESGSASLQNPSKALAGREDAYFISDNNWLGVADGVSQWSFEEINEGMYAQELMSNFEKIISVETAEICDPVQVLHRSVSETKSSGSCTALIAHLSNNELHVANAGDSGFIVIRNRTVLHKSSPMFHHFCFPLHITRGDDVLKLAEVYHVNVEEGDVVITATDGLFDNLYEKEIVSIVCRLLEQGLEPQRIAELLAAKAQEVGRSETEKTPFADAAKEEGHDGYRGGKLDAVTVIVSLVKTVSI